mgnify:CR=1 FL=1
MPKRIRAELERKYNIKIEGANNITCNVCGHKWTHIVRSCKNLSCPNCHPIQHGSSRGECELYDMLATTGLRIIHNETQILEGKELDIFFPDIKFAIEYDGKHWHSPEKDEIKNKLCEEKGIELVRVTDDFFKKHKEEFAQLIVDKYLNNKYNLNVSLHLDKIKDVVRESGKCRKIICTDTGVVYNNYIEACKAFDCKVVSNITNVCSKIPPFKNFKGYHFEWYEEGKIYPKTEISYAYGYHPIKCIETGEVFKSINDIKRIGVTSVDDCLYGNQKTACGLHWEKTQEKSTDTSITEQLIKEYLEKGIQYQSTNRKVICVNTGETFSSETEAAKYFGIGKYSVLRCCKGEIEKTKSGLRFMFEDESERVEFKSKRKLKRVLCTDLNIEFDSCKEAAEYFGTKNADIISRTIRGQNGRKSYKGHTFKYID